MIALGQLLLTSFIETIVGVTPVMVLLLTFQWGVIRKPLPHWRRLAVGMVFVVGGMTLFLTGLETALFPLGRTMAEQLVSMHTHTTHWLDYGWVYAFAAVMGFSTTIAEPALIAVSLKAQEISRGTIRSGGLRLAVALGVAVGIAAGCLRIVLGVSLPMCIISGYIVVLLMTAAAPKDIMALAFDSGGVTTSTVTVPVVAALGIGLAENIPGRSPMLDGFGLIAFASLFPIISVMGYAMRGDVWARRRSRQGETHAL